MAANALRAEHLSPISDPAERARRIVEAITPDIPALVRGPFLSPTARLLDSWEDAEQQAFLGLAKAARRYDPARRSEKTGQPIRPLSHALPFMRASLQRMLSKTHRIVRNASGRKKAILGLLADKSALEANLGALLGIVEQRDLF